MGDSTAGVTELTSAAKTVVTLVGPMADTTVAYLGHLEAAWWAVGRANQSAGRSVDVLVGKSAALTVAGLADVRADQ